MDSFNKWRPKYQNEQDYDMKERLKIDEDEYNKRKALYEDMQENNKPEEIESDEETKSLDKSSDEKDMEDKLSKLYSNYGQEMSPMQKAILMERIKKAMIE